MAVIDTASSTTTSPSSAFTGVIIGLVSSFGSIIIIALMIFAFWVSGCSGGGRILLDRIGRPGEYDDEQAFAREEAEALETMDEMARAEYLRAKAFVTANPPESLQTEISLSQFLAIQEKGVSAWEFEPELEIANCFVEARTEIEFFDAESTVLTNLPVPKQNDVYYWEAKIYDKPENTLLSIGMATKPYPLFRLPGFHKYSAAYQSTGHRRYNQPFSKYPYGPAYVQGDVIGVGYRPRTGAIFFTRNGKRLEEMVHGLKAQNFFPAIGAIGPATVHVNFGQAGFVFIEANVKKWGLAPVTGSLAPPPPYGSEQGSILLETGSKDGFTGTPTASSARARAQSYSAMGSSYSVRGPDYGPYQSNYNTNPSNHTRHHSNSNANSQNSNLNAPTHGRTRSGNHFRILPPTSPGPIRSPTDISLAHLVPTNEDGEPSGSYHDDSDRDDHDDGPEDENPLRLHLEDATNPPPGYASPTEDDANSARFQSGRHSTDSQTPLVHSARSRGDSSATVVPWSPGRSRSSTTQHGHSASAAAVASRSRSQSQVVPTPDEPVPSYFDAMRQGAGRQQQQDSASASESERESGSGSGSEGVSPGSSAGRGGEE